MEYQVSIYMGEDKGTRYQVRGYRYVQVQVREIAPKVYSSTQFGIAQDPPSLSAQTCQNWSAQTCRIWSAQSTHKFELHEIQVDDEYQPVSDSTTTWYQKYYQYQYRLLQAPELAFEYYDLWRISTRGIISENTSTRVLSTWVRITY